MSKLKQKYSEYSSSTSEEEEDEDIIHCICDSTADDGFTIQCEKCDTWQHAKCYHIKKKNIPEHFICDRCHVKKQQQPRRRNSLDSSAEKRKKKVLTKREDNNKKRLRDSDEEAPKKFIPITKSVAKEKVVQDLFIEVHRQWIESNRPLRNSTTSTSTINKKTGNKGLDSIVVMESNLLLPAIPKASLKPIRKSLRGTSFFQNKNDPTVKKGIFADIHIPENRYLMEVIGQVVRKSEYKADQKNKFLALGIPLSHIFFYPSLDICIDARFTGNDTRFIRRSCCPNSEMKSIILPNDSEDQTIHLGVYTKEPVDKGEEITIGWNWHKGHIMWKKNKEFISKSSSEIMDEATKKSLQDTINLIQNEFGKCACEDEEDCLFEYLKDELEREEDDKVEIVTKKKSAVKSRKEPKEKPTPPTSIFTSDEDESPKPKKPDQRNKPVKQLKTVEKTSSKIPSSPAVSVEESVDIDVTSMSPAPEEMNTGGLKRPRSFTATPLPCKKRWLKIYAAQQKQQLQTEVVPSINFASTSPVDIPPPATSSPSDLNSKYLENEYDEGELSDGGSSQSTLPLDDSVDNNTNLPLDNTETNSPAKDTQDTIIDTKDPEKVKYGKEDTQEDKLIPDTTETKPESDKMDTSKSSECNNTIEGTSSPINEEDTSSAPKVKKLSVQEYLKRQRGNLPTPDEKL